MKEVETGESEEWVNSINNAVELYSKNLNP